MFEGVSFALFCFVLFLFCCAITGGLLVVRYLVGVVLLFWHTRSGIIAWNYLEFFLAA